MGQEEKTKYGVKKKSDSFLKYSGIAYQMAGLLLVSILGGQWLDNHFENEKAYFTAGLSLFFVVGYLVKLYFELSKENQ